MLYKLFVDTNLLYFNSRFEYYIDAGSELEARFILQEILNDKTVFTQDAYWFYHDIGKPNRLVLLNMKDSNYTISHNDFVFTKTLLSEHDLEFSNKINMVLK